jgi:urea transport system ATP-binding protein
VSGAGGSLVVTDLRVTFDEFVAVGGVSFDAHPGEVRFLIGPNGAGKTTCIDAITGLSKGTGSVTLGDQELLGKSTQKIVRLGVGRTFQTASVFEQLSVLQNLDIAAGIHRSSWSLLRARRGVDPAVEVALEETGLSKERDTPAGILSHGQKQWLEIGMMLVQDPRALLLDEPVAGMSQDERTATGELLHRIAKNRVVLVVEHDMDFMRRYATRVTVLHQGSLLSEGTVAQVQADPKVQEVYLGTAGAATTTEMLVVADSTSEGSTAVTDAGTPGATEGATHGEGA